MLNSIKKFMKEEDGLTAFEYVIAAGLLAVALSTLFASYGTQLQTKLNTILNSTASGPA